MSVWQPIKTAPRDGTPVWLCDESGDADGPWPMYYAKDGTNSFFQRGVGIWTLEGGGMTWTEENQEGAPTLWAPRESNACPTPPWKIKH